MTVRMTRWVLGLAVAGAAMVLMLAQAAHAQAGDVWHGALNLAGSELRVVLKLQGDGGVLLSPDQTDKEIPVAEVKRSAEALAFAAPAVNGAFAGSWDANAKAWAGRWTQNGRTLPLALEAGDLPPRPVISGLDGAWTGAVAAGDVRLNIVLHVRTGPYGTAASMDSPDQKVLGLPVKLSRSGDAVRFEAPVSNLVYTGTLAKDGNTIVGKTDQLGLTNDLTLTRTPAG